MRYSFHFVSYIWFVFTIYLHWNSHISRSQQQRVNSGDVIRKYRVTAYTDTRATAGLGTGRKRTEN